METKYNIRHLRNHEINFIKWDNCINNSHNGNIYAFSWYLDIVCEDWEALINSDYEAVMPIFPDRKAGISYTYTSYLANQLGVFSTEILDEKKVDAFVMELSKVYPNFFINLNKFNNLDSKLFHQQLKPTYEFDLIGNYRSIQNNYTEENRTAIEEAEKNGITIIKGMLPNDFLNFTSGKKVTPSIHLNNKEFAKLRRIMAFVLQHGLGEILSAYGPDNSLVAAGLFLKSNRKCNVLFTAIDSYGIKLKAMHKMIDYYVQKHAGEHLTLNFENLKVPDPDKFCMGFGAKEFHYIRLTNSNIPWYNKVLLGVLKRSFF